MNYIENETRNNMKMSHNKINKHYYVYMIKKNK